MNRLRLCGAILSTAAAVLGLASTDRAAAGTLMEDRPVLVQSINHCWTLPYCNPSAGGLVDVRPGGTWLSLPLGESGSRVYADVEVSDTRLTVWFEDSVHFQDQAPAFSGLQLWSATAAMPSFTSAALTYSSIDRYTDELQDRLRFNAQGVQMDFGGLQVRAGDRLEFEFNSPAPVPEPASAALLGAGACVLIWVMRRRS